MMWGTVFTIGATLALQRALAPVMPAWAYEAASYTLLIGAMFMGTWYPERLKRRREAQVVEAS